MKQTNKNGREKHKIPKIREMTIRQPFCNCRLINNFDEIVKHMFQ